ncbi:MAG TPA: hypothetical protein VE075_07095, partial [Thermoanaerobaculia bacterium]|nr:hypothetical protein [Thermoanaerobaculia bacterium]
MNERPQYFNTVAQAGQATAQQTTARQAAARQATAGRPRRSVPAGGRPVQTVAASGVERVRLLGIDSQIDDRLPDHL